MVYKIFVCWLSVEMKERMSVSLFNAVPAEAIEVLTDGENQPWFKRAHVGKFLELQKILMSDKGLDKCEMKTRDTVNPKASNA